MDGSSVNFCLLFTNVIHLRQTHWFLDVFINPIRIQLHAKIGARIDRVTDLQLVEVMIFPVILDDGDVQVNTGWRAGVAGIVA